ncbi:OmpA family protein [Falsirhodobacter sp. 20TX0035]|uniref:OmpA family protein n=1 Tax=Falsirhodobacter sp. 20TX0035 TaxID=3022019 RepID=UPI00233085CB|nr:OmpA family protein [Falsirhodobacter sp. 20TX0035]MDB6454547.1 OmpA family protein [Falsirhodobacter sp. 20TX0035]
MTRRSLRSRLLSTTAALSVVLASMTPARLPAQEAAPAEVPPATAPSQTTPSEAEAPAPEPVPEEPAPEPEAAPEPAPRAPAAAQPEVEAPAEAPAARERAPEPETSAPAAREERSIPAPEADVEAPEAEVTEPEAPAADTPAEATPRATEAPDANEAPDADAPATNSTDEPEPPADSQRDEGTGLEEDEQTGRGAATEGADDAEAPANTRTNGATDAPAAGDTRTEGTSEAPATGGTTADRASEAPAAGETTEAAEPIDPATAEVDEQEAVDTLNSVLGGTDTAAPLAAAAAAAAGSDAASDNATVTEVTEENARSSSEDFATTASGDARDRNDDDDDDGGLSNLQKVGLLALGGLAVGALMNNGDEVVSNTGDRVVLRQNDGSYQVLKDDDALLRQPGSTVRTENYADGSTRSIVEQGDGSRIETIRDASGRVLRRARIDTDGRQTLLIDDTRQAAPVDLSLLPRSREDVRVSATDRTSLREALDRIETRDNARLYSLSQIRDYREVRALAPVVDVENITFRTGSAAVDASEAEQLSDLGNLMRDLIDERPGEMFLIEGHTDAVGSAASNLALSDRRAESVALALTEYFDVPPENMVVQGYGESDLRVQTEGDESRNRRVAVRIITPVLQVAQNR